MTRMVSDSEGHVVFDVGGKLPGRGAWVCPRISCIRALRPSSLSHVLKAEVQVPAADLLRDSLGTALESRLRNLLTIGRKSGQVVVGSTAVTDAGNRDRVELFLVADDASERTRASLLRLAEGLPVGTLPSSSTVGGWVGRTSVATAAVVDRGLARRLEEILARLTAIEYPPYHSSNAFPTQED